MKDYSKENLDVTHYRNGDPIPFVKSGKKWEALTTGAYCYYDNDPEKSVLYNWHAVNDSRGLAPEGWKIPTIEELEQIDLTTGLPGGYRSNYGYSSSVGNGGYWWSSSENSTDNAWHRYLSNSNGSAGSYDNGKGNGFSVRCLKDEIVINKRNKMEVVIDGIVYVPKELEKKVEPVIVEKNYKFELHPIISTNKLQWGDAAAYAKSLGDGWRLPTIEECFIMYNTKVITEGVYWSSSEYYDSYAWHFNFKYGTAYYSNQYDTYFVRAVRSL
jgi:hypothetical protein